MVAGCGMKCIKFTVFFFNFLFLLVGVALIAAGAYIMSLDYVSMIPGIKIAAGLVLAIGVVIFIPAFCGCCGACRESQCLLITYAVIMGILLLVEVIIAITGFVMSSKIRGTAEQGMFESMKLYQTDPRMQAMWAFMQNLFDCCGVHKASDWQGMTNNTYDVPDSCCRADRKEGTCVTTNILKKTAEEQSQMIYQQGCLDHIEALVKPYLYIVCGVIIGIALVELIGVIFAAMLARAVKENAA